MDSRGEKLCAEAEQLKGEMSAFQSTWQDCADHALPLRRLGFNQAGSTFKPDARLQSDVAVDALHTLASGMVSWVTPSQQNWFSWKPADSLSGSGEVADWLADCTTRAHRALESSNFYGTIHLLFQELGGFGTGGIYCEEGMENALNFRMWHAGTFAGAENTEGLVNRVFRFFNYTAQQAVEKFGEAAPEECRKDVDANRRHNLHSFIHAIYPRDQKDRNPAGGLLGMPVASCYLYPKNKRIIREEGFDAMPVKVARWLKWSEESIYGVSPAMLSLADLRGANNLESNLAAILHLNIQPRLITSTDLVGTVDLGPGGITQVKSMGEAPQVWAQPNDIRMGMELVNRVDNRIRRAFHMPLFEQFQMLEREITATEVRARQAEQLNRISPAFTLLTTDLINPLLERVFMILFRSGRFAKAPREAFVQDGAGQWRLLFPKTIQISRMAQAIEEMKQHAFDSTLATFVPYLELKPGILDNINFDAALRDIARGKGVPRDYLNDEEAMAEMRAQQAQAQQAQQALELAAKQPELAMAAAGAATGQAA